MPQGRPAYGYVRMFALFPLFGKVATLVSRTHRIQGFDIVLGWTP